MYEYKFGINEIGYSAVAIQGFKALLKDAALEILTFVPVIG
ncbi:MAG: hypothetical protein Q8K73_05475 [Anaerolineales bacterium]|nr:hypothetical protein [Anaerolineales bacterium]